MFRKIQLFLNYDVESFLSKIKISPISKRAFFWTFIIVNIVFLWHTLAFIPDNHTVLAIKTGLPIDFQFRDRIGRFSGGVLQQIFGGDILPIINSVFCYFGFVIGMILLADYWKLPKTVFLYTLFALFVIVLPFTLPWVYFVRHNTYFWNIFFIIEGLQLCLKGRPFSLILAIALFVFCLGCHVSMIQVIFVAFLGRCLMDNLHQNLPLSKLLMKYWKTGCSILCSVIIFTLIMYYLKSSGLMGTGRSTNIVLPINLEHINPIINSFLKEMPHMPVWFRIMLLLPIIGVVAFCYIKDRYVSLLFIFAILVFSQLTNFLAGHDFTNTVRVMFFTFPWIYILFLTIFIRWGKIWKNIAIILMFTSIWYSILQDIRWQKSFVAESRQEIQTYIDINRKIKAHSSFDPNKEYKLVMIGQFNAKGTFSKNYKEWPGVNIYINWPLNSADHPHHILNFWEKRNYITNNFRSDYGILRQIDAGNAKKMDVDFLLNKAKPYPHENSVSVDDHFIYVIFDEDILNKVKEKIKGLMQGT